jgi:glyoxylase-like metal-dependent hydrolase (beta-lactamase superfamily II)
MRLYPINTGFFKLDGGAMFGVVPKSIWQKTNPADSNNMCTWAMRCLLVEEGNRLILVDCGIGNKQSEKFFGYYDLHGTDSLDGSLGQYGFTRNDITDVFLTHLHFDHCGGAIAYDTHKERYYPAFPNASFHSTERHWLWATRPNPREKASFLSENILPIQESGRLEFLARPDKTRIGRGLMEGMEVFFADGHTDSQMIPLFRLGNRTLAFMADLLPSTGHIPLAYVMGYDTRPLLTLDEKEQFMKMAADNEWILFLEHDSINECCTVEHTEKGIRLKYSGKLSDFAG